MKKKKKKKKEIENRSIKEKKETQRHPERNPRN
jgi:hypothetical protein